MDCFSIKSVTADFIGNKTTVAGEVHVLLTVVWWHDRSDTQLLWLNWNLWEHGWVPTISLSVFLCCHTIKISHFYSSCFYWQKNNSICTKSRICCKARHSKGKKGFWLLVFQTNDQWNTALMYPRLSDCRHEVNTHAHIAMLIELRAVAVRSVGVYMNPSWCLACY